MASITIPVPSLADPGKVHYFDQQELNDAVTRMLGTLPPERKVGFGAAVDKSGVGAALVFHETTEHGWVVGGAIAAQKGWSGEWSAGASLTLQK